ncbi:MAG: twin-arginine translocase subunit TatC [Chitinispirillaceae bacterium]|nr:twin-arginine translocase subunit TatC [Chitinispirillaceae bacterium]
MTDDKGELSFLGHLEELRWRLIKAAIAIMVCAIPSGIFWKKILDFVLIYPLRHTSPRPKLIYTNPSESVVLSFKIAIAGGLIAASPIIFYQLWRFISPGLYRNEKKVILPAVFASTFFFIGGIAFSYYTFPILLRFLTAYAGSRLDPMFKIDEYFTFLLKISLSFGAVFELPVISYVLARMGVLTAGFLIKKFRYAIVAIFIAAAILTPPDVISQTMLAGPLLLLYGISVIVAAVASRRKAE